MLDDYEAKQIKDEVHEMNMKNAAAVLYIGEYLQYVLEHLINYHFKLELNRWINILGPKSRKFLYN